MHLRQYLKSNNEGIAAFAGRLGVTSEAVRLWLASERMPRPKWVKRIAKATKGAVKPADWYGGLP